MGFTTSEENISAIQELRNRCTRIITFAPYNSYVEACVNQSFLNLKSLKYVYDFHDKSFSVDLMY